jgi:tetratricopeptide (TPR) repeat protein
MFAVVATAAAAWWLGRRGPARDGGGARRLAAAATVAAAAFAGWGAWFVATDRFYVSDGTSRRTGFSMSALTYPQGMADFILAARPPAPLFNDFASGSYLAYRLYPEYQVFITGNTFKYPPEFFQRYHVVSLGRDEYQQLAQEYRLAGFAIMYSSGDMMPLAKRLFNDPDYAPVYFDDNALLFLRRTPDSQPFLDAHRVDFAEVARRRAAEPLPPPPSPLGRARGPRGELNRATFLHRVGLFPAADVEYRRALSIDPDIPEAKEGLGEVLLGQGRFADALAVLQPLRAERPRHAHVVRDLAQVYSGLGSEAAAAGRWDEAVASLSEALRQIDEARRMDPAGDPLRRIEANDRYNLAWSLWRRAPDDPATGARVDEEIARALELQPDDAPLRYRAARLRARQGRADEAISLLSAALAASPSLAAEARQDPSFGPLHADPRFRDLVSAR